MASCKFTLCLLFVGFLGISNAASIQSGYRPPGSAGPVIAIEKVNNMTPSMQLDASDFLKRAYTLTTSADRCSMLGQLFAEKYPQQKWHVVAYQAYSVQALKSIVLKVTNNNHIELFLLFSTKN